MKLSDVKPQIDAHFDAAKPHEVVARFEALGCVFEDIKPEPIMKEQQIFKPFDEFKAGEFEEIFGNNEPEYDTYSYTFKSVLQRHGVVSFHIVEHFGQNGNWFSINYRLFHEQNQRLNTLRGLDLLWEHKKGKYITFGTLKEAYTMLIKIIALEVLAAERDLADYENRYGMTIEAFREQQEQKFAKMKYFAKCAIKDLREPLDLVKAQFIELRKSYTDL